MPGSSSKPVKYSADLPYPEPRVEKENTYYADLLLEDYAGLVSEFSAVSLYSYQHFISDGEYADYAKLIEGISMVEMRHLELLGETIKLLGIKPMFRNSTSVYGQYWKGEYLNYTIDIKEMISEDIESERKAIENYKYHISLIKDKYITNLLERIILDEDIHIKYFKEIYDVYKNRA